MPSSGCAQASSQAQNTGISLALSHSPQGSCLAWLLAPYEPQHSALSATKGCLQWSPACSWYHSEIAAAHAGVRVQAGTGDIPQFHFPHGRPLSPEQAAVLKSKQGRLLARHAAGLSVPAFKELMTEVNALLTGC